MLSCILDQVCTHACDALKLKQHPTSHYDNSILTVYMIATITGMLDAQLHYNLLIAGAIEMKNTAALQTFL